LIGVGLAAFLEWSDLVNRSEYDSSTATWLEVTYITSWVFAAIYCLVMMCNFKSLRVSIAIIETAADFFADTKRIVFIPVIYFAVGILIFFAWVYGVICVASIGPIYVDNINLQSKTVDRTEGTNWEIAGMFFGFLWIASMLIAMNDYVVIVSSATWYFSRKDVPDDDGIAGDADVWKGFWWSFRYNFGSLAMGSFILTLVWIVRLIFEFVGELLKDSTGGNSCVRCLLICIRCCLDCFDRFVRFLNSNAYIYMAISGESFCPSALHSFLLILKNAAKFAFVNGMASIFMFLAKFTIAIVTALICWGLLKVWPDDAGTQGTFMPCAFVFLFAYLIGSTFISIFDTSSICILQCYLKDLDIAKQSGLDPTHVPETLARFLMVHSDHKCDGEAVVAARKASALSEQSDNLLQ
jgi:choline transporter-like protein 2/4/5